MLLCACVSLVVVWTQIHTHQLIYIHSYALPSNTYLYNNTQDSIPVSFFASISWARIRSVMRILFAVSNQKKMKKKKNVKVNSSLYPLSSPPFAAISSIISYKNLLEEYSFLRTILKQRRVNLPISVAGLGITVMQSRVHTTAFICIKITLKKKQHVYRTTGNFCFWLLSFWKWREERKKD